jgi:hypothetical protein
VCERERYKQTDRQAERRRNKQSLAYLSQFLHLVGADVRAVSESKIEEEPLSVEVLALHSLASLIDLLR